MNEHIYTLSNTEPYPLHLVSPDNKALYTISVPVKDEEIDDVIDKKRKLLYLMHSKGGCGLAANQIGDTRRYFMFNKTLVINPVITRMGESQEDGREGCLSFPGETSWVKRSRIIEVEYMNDQRKIVKETLRGDKARIFQHEFDHINGVVIINK